jgi:hypothetical protein
MKNSTEITQKPTPNNTKTKKPFFQGISNFVKKGGNTIREKVCVYN